MCTVTFIPYRQRIFLSSNRDEYALRPTAMPRTETRKTGQIVFPKDGQAGGTWIALHENGNAMVLLNGAFERHKHRPPYRTSRGVIFLDIFDSISPIDSFSEIDLYNIEPFTLVIWQHNILWEARWDGQTKYKQHMDAAVPHIWSSASLYDPEVRAGREQWFADWLATKPAFSQDTIRHFHTFGGNGDAHNDLRMNREGLLQTVSITTMELSATTSEMKYEDLQNGKTVDCQMPIQGR